MKHNNINQAEKLRELISSALPDTPISEFTPSEGKFIYLPDGHVNALQPDRPLVVGGRGTGKSFWWGCLLKDNLNAQTETLLARRNALKKEFHTVAYAGYGNDKSIKSYLDKDVFENLLECGCSPRHIWRTIVLNCFFTNKYDIQGIPDEWLSLKWSERVLWLQKNPDITARIYGELNEQCRQKQRIGMIVFDALDTTASAWKSIHALLKGLFENLLDFMGYSNIRLKAFVRQDMIEATEEVFSFPDASKIKTSQTTLEWPVKDLYGLFWQYLGNAPDAEDFRKLTEDISTKKWEQDKNHVWQMPSDLRDNEIQREIFEKFVGKQMGAGAKKGLPYSWLPNHLGDGHDKVSPRSFLKALLVASQQSPEGYSLPLHYKAIQSGVQAASKVRVSEIAEDYPWIVMYMAKLENLLIPCHFQEIVTRWEEISVTEATDLSKGISRYAAEGPEGVRKELEEIGIFRRMRDGRVNIPDVYRLGYNLKRKGGIKPIR